MQKLDSFSTDMKKTLLTAFMVAAAVATWAQSGTNSPYSQYGFGKLSDQSTGFNRGMNGLAMGFRDGNQVNFLNPASYSSVDSLTFIFDAGVSGQLTNFNENGLKKNAKNADFEYAVAAFRALPNLGVSFGVVPFTNVGYNYSNSNEVGDMNSTYYVNTYSGNGGLHQAYLGFGWQPFKGLSIGVNGSYLWGDYDRSVVNSYSDGYVNTISKYYSADVQNYKIDAGLQLYFKLSKKTDLLFGATYGYGHKIDADPEVKIISRNTQTAVSDTTTFVVKDGLELPSVFTAGFLIDHEKRIRFGADFSLQKWGDTSFPVDTKVNNVSSYELSKNYFKDVKKITVGGEYCRNPLSRKFFNTVRYKVGASYTTPYLIINGKDGPKELGVSAGFSFPISNQWNNRSILNISGQWVHASGTGMLTENTFRINIGLTFNERWFMKWKVE